MPCQHREIKMEQRIAPILIFLLSIVALLAMHQDPGSAPYIVQVIAIIAGVLGIKRNFPLQ